MTQWVGTEGYESSRSRGTVALGLCNSCLAEVGVVMDSCSPRPKCRIPAGVQGVAKHLRALWGTAGAGVSVAGAEDQDKHPGSSEPEEEPSLQQSTPVKLALVPHAQNL